MFVKRLITGIIATLSALTLSGCVSMRAPSLNAEQTAYQKATPLTRQQRLQAIHSWSINGAVSVKQPKQSFIARYNWQQKNARFNIELHSNLDIASISLSGKPGLVSMTASNGQVAKSHNLYQLMQQQLGWALPVDNLRYWIRSLPAPGPASVKTNNLGQTTQLKQGPWSVSFSRYQRIGNAELPSHLNIDGPQLRLRIVIKNWSIRS